MSKTPKFKDSKTAVVIIAWNSGCFLDACLSSVLSLECRQLDVWVVENGSRDNTGEILRRYAERHDNCHPIWEMENLGTTQSRNKALRQIDSDTDYVVVLDSDTVVNQDAFEAMAKTLSDDGSIGVVGPTMMTTGGEEQLSGRNLPTLSLKIAKACPFGNFAKKASDSEVPKNDVVNGIQDVGYLLAACWMMTKSTLDTVGLLDEKIFYSPEDVDWCVRCHISGLRVVRCYDARITHEYQRLSHKKLISKTNLEHTKGLLYYFKKYKSFFRAPDFG